MIEPKKLDVAIIGGGWSGILACKYMTQNGLNALAFEGTDSIGGVFKYREEVTDAGSVIKSTHTTSSRTTTEMSDYPMPHTFPPFPSHKQIMTYLNDYIDHFKIREKILLNTKILKVEKKNDKWILEDSHGQVYESSNLIVCSGVHQYPDMFFHEDERFKHATVETMHACAYKKPIAKFEDKRILLYGGGETASDIAAELCNIANGVILSVPHGQWLVNRYRRTSDDISHPFVLDEYTSELRLLVDPADKGYYAQYVIEKEGGICGHGVKEWISPAPYLGQFLNKSAHINHYLVMGSLIPKGEVDRVIGNEVQFSDGTKDTIDMIIFCCGYKTVFPFFKEDKYNAPINEKFKFIFDNEDPTLAFIGFARPVVGSIPAISEMQSMYVGKVFSGKTKLPSKEKRTQIIQRDQEFQAEHFSKTSNRIKGLVNFGVYVDQLAILSGCNPDLIKLFFKSPKKWLLAISAPYNNCKYRINEESLHDQIFDTLKHRIHPSVIKNRYHAVKILFLNFFPFLFLKQNQHPAIGKVLDFINASITTLIWILFTPFILFRIVFNRIKSRRNET